MAHADSGVAPRRTLRPDQPVTFSGWRDTVARSLLSFDFDFDEPQSFKGAVQSKPFADLEFINMVCGRHAAYRDASKIELGQRPEYLMTLQLSGEFRLTQEGRTAVLKPGHFTFYDSTKPASLESSDDYRSLCIKFPKKLIGPAGDAVSELTATRIDADSGLAPSVWALLSTLNETLDNVSNVNRYSTVSSVMNLVGTMLASQAGAPAPAHPKETRASLLQRIHEYIDDHLGDPELGPQEVAGAHFISVRYLHSLFQDSGTSVAASIRDRRVERCRIDLADPALISVPASAIASRWGFKGASHFGQIFKAATGLTPAEFRHHATTGSH
ncbi:transcriptional regulator, AraC family protein [Arthrobacter crystallopoietes BAB-32]|uniref:Transcriptional regulator, AraC family protein n=1 Tax=Arthrobacter crystallopoietes BAB-32 TaxID=1246476 RepID=N1V895_9MICC|nr:helix-turn-helix domain-containing protein [Arthrobacter crystallopoietes]EMY34478.1 transcriptional regulator, AraC family protein [Arthrobacter crystallopoietes BAB-32]